MTIDKRVLFRVIGMVFLLSTMLSCKSRSDDDTSLKRVQLSTIRAEQQAKQICQTQSDKTNQNLCFLNEYGKALLSLKTDNDDISAIVESEFKKRGITSFLQGRLKPCPRNFGAKKQPDITNFFGKFCQFINDDQAKFS